MNPELSERLGQLRRMTTGQLKERYRDLFGRASHSNHKDYLFRRVAWRLQSLTEGGLSERARQFAREIAEDADLRLCAPKNVVSARAGVLVATASGQVDRRLPAPGTQLIKRYKQETITVTVLEDGFQHGERVYKSLSAIARQVTGTQWNGFSFFGLTSEKEARRGTE